MGYMRQRALPFSSYFKNGQLMTSLQQAPQPMHFPRLLEATGNQYLGTRISLPINSLRIFAPDPLKTCNIFFHETPVEFEPDF